MKLQHKDIKNIRNTKINIRKKEKDINIQLNNEAFELYRSNPDRISKNIVKKLNHFKFEYINNYNRNHLH